MWQGGGEKGGGARCFVGPSPVGNTLESVCLCCLFLPVVQDVSDNQISLQDMLDQLFTQVSSSSSNGGSTSPVCTSKTGASILPARVAAAPAAVRLRRSGKSDKAAAATAAMAAAQAAAALNADAGNAQRYNIAEVRHPKLP